MESHEKELLIFIDRNLSKLKKNANNSLYDLFKECLSFISFFSMGEGVLLESHKKELLLYIDINNFHCILFLGTSPISLQIIQISLKNRHFHVHIRHTLSIFPECFYIRCPLYDDSICPQEVLEL